MVTMFCRYVASHMGGQVERSGPLCFELPAGMKQLERESNLVPLGEFHQGSFQHRALLFKVLPMQLAVSFITRVIIDLSTCACMCYTIKWAGK